MKEYMKPEVEIVDFSAEVVMTGNQGSTTTTSIVEDNPYG